MTTTNGFEEAGGDNPLLGPIEGKAIAASAARSTGNFSANKGPTVLVNTNNAAGAAKPAATLPAPIYETGVSIQLKYSARARKLGGEPSNASAAGE
jgi:hypothetical protein